MFTLIKFNRTIGSQTWYLPAILILLFGAIWPNGVCVAQSFRPATKPGSTPAFHPNRLLIKPKAVAGRGTAVLTQLHAMNGGHVLRDFPGIGGLQVVEFSGLMDVKGMIETYRKSGIVEYVEPDYEVHAVATPNDPQFLNGVLWGLNNTGQNGGFNDADLDAPEGWNVRHDAGDVIVAVIDSGVRYTHEDLAANMWTNPGEVPGNGIDDDGDGYVEDLHGINAITGTGNPNDDHGHGTHVAGIIGAVGNNGIGAVGVAWQVRLMACKFIDTSGSGFVSDAITCIDYARVHGAKVMNNSWGGSGYSQALKNAIDAAGAAGIIFVAAAGNNSSDNDITQFYPAGYNCDNIVVVAATTRTDDLAYFSNFGLGSVDVGAPGLDITSTWNGSDSAYTSLSGTSMASPEVAGVFALMRAQFPGETYQQLFNRVYGSVDPLSSLANKCRTEGRINLARALNSVSSQPGNDNFTNRLVITKSSFSIKGLNIDGTKEPGEPNHGGNVGGKSIWWSWRPSASGVVTITTTGSTFNTLLGVYTGGSVSNLTVVAANDDDPTGGTTSRVTFDATGGVDYSIAVDGFAGASGKVVLNVSLQPRPLNDNFTNRIVINSSFSTVQGSNVLATSEVGEPLHAMQTGGKSVWWSWTALNSEPATISTTGSDFNTLLAVYTGTSISNLTAVASNDNDPSGGVTSRVNFNTVAGTTYQIAVDGTGGGSGNIMVNTPPANDHFANRIILNGASATAAGFNILATKDPLEPNHGGNSVGKSLWWSWTAPASGKVSISTAGSTFDTVLAVYTGSVIGNLTLVAANDNDPYGNVTSLVSFNAVAGTTYQIAVDGANGASGRVQLGIGNEYVITEIDGPPGYLQCDPRSINLHGTVVGAYISPAPDYTHHAFIWTEKGGMQALMTGDTGSEAEAINDYDQVVGYLAKPGYGSIAFLWQNGVVRELGGLTPHAFSGAYSIDNAGRVVGWSLTTNNSVHAFMWQDGIMTDLGAMGTDRTAAYGVNWKNLIVGGASDASASGGRPIVWQDNVIKNIVMPAGASGGGALAVNFLSQVAGYYSSNYNGTFYRGSFLWEDGITTDLGGLPGSYAESLNNLGQIVGGDADFNAVLLWQNGHWTNVLSLLPKGSLWTALSFGHHINDHGQIVGNGTINGNTRGFLLTPLNPPTPIPIILSPTNRQSFFAGEEITLNSVIVPTATNVTRVDYFQGASLIGSATTAPYQVIWKNALAGQYALSARTVTDSGAMGTSKVVTVSVVLPPRLSFGPPTNQDAFTLRWPATAGFLLESATNLNPPIAWMPVTNQVIVLNNTNSTTINMGSGNQYFRLRR